MDVTFLKSQPQGSIIAVPSKSVAHRMLICAALSDGETVIQNLPDCDDIKATCECICGLGGIVTRKENTATVKPIPHNSYNGRLLPCHNSASTLRFMLPLSLIFDRQITFTFTSQLSSRLLDTCSEVFHRQSISLCRHENTLSVSGELTPGKYCLPGNIGSQYVSGLMFALPLLNGESEILVSEPMTSKPYIDLTLSVLRSFGIRMIQVSENDFSVPGHQIYQSAPCIVEGDWSNSAFFEAFRTLGYPVSVLGLDKHSVQGDKICIDYFEKIKHGCPTLDVTDYPDLAPILAVLSSFFYGCKLTGTKRLAYKESNRTACLADELQKFGIKTRQEEDSFSVVKSKILRPRQPISSHADHRLAMAFSVLLSQTGGTLTDAEAVNKSYPDFFEKLASIGINFTVSDK